MNQAEIEKSSQIIKSLLRANPSRQTLKEFISLSVKMISAYLFNKEKYPGYYKNIFGISINDLAFDVLADCFKKNEEGYYTEFTNYFKALEEKCTLSSEEYIIYLRRLLFSKVNHRLYRINKEFDPILAKLIRNIKNAVSNSSSYSIIVYNEQNSFVPFEYNPTRDVFPLTPIELLELEWFPINFTEIGLNKSLEQLLAVINTWGKYKKLVYVTDIATILKKTLNDGIVELFPNQNNINNDDGDIERLFSIVLDEVVKPILDKYLANNKINFSDHEIFLQVSKDIILDLYINNTSSSESFYEYLIKYKETLTTEEYLSKYRTKLEYLIKLSKQAMNETIKKEYFSL